MRPRRGRPRAVGHPATETIPLGALAHLLPPDLTRQLGIGDDDRFVLFHRARQHLAEISDSERLLLLIDDVDQLDATSLALLLPLTIERKVFLIATIRSTHQLPSVIASLLKDGQLTLEAVPVLNADEVATLVHRVLNDPVDSDAASRLAQWSGGNLQVLHEIVRRSLEQGTLFLDGGVWRLTQLPTSATLDELVRAQLAELHGHGHRALEVLAVAGALGLADLEGLAGGDVVADLDRRGLLRTTVDGRRTRTTLTHPVYGEIIRRQMSVVRTRAVQRVLADLLEAHGARRREDTTRLALWRLEAGGADVDGDLFVNVGRLAILGRDGPLARRFAAAARDRDRVHDATLIDVEAALLDADVATVERVVTVVLEDLSLPQSIRSHIARRLASRRFWSGDLDGGLDALAAAECLLDEPAHVAAVRAHRALLLANNGRPNEALLIVDEIDVVDDPRVRIDVAIARSIGCISVGRFSEAIAAAHEGLRTQADLPVWQARRATASHQLNEAHALLYSGRFTQARAVIDGAVAGARAVGARAALVWFEVVLGEIDRDTGRGEDAIRHFAAATELAASAGQHAALVWAHVGVAQGHLLLGDSHAGAAALALADQHTSPVATSWSTRERARAWLLACEGDLPAARRLITQVAAVARRDDLLNFECGVVHDLARFGDPGAAVARLEELVQVVEGPYVRALAAHARAATNRDVGAYRNAIEQLVAMGCLVLGAEAAMELADVHLRAGDSRQAAAATREALALVGAAGGARTPGLLRGNAVEPLSDREREVALLASSGVASKEIARRLFLSKRTVDSHLNSIYRKLGVARREELPAALDPPAAHLEAQRATAIQ